MFEGIVQRFDSLRETVDNTMVMKRLLEGTLEHFEIPLNVTKLHTNALTGLKLKSLVIHKGVEELNSQVQDMSSLERIDIYSSVLRRHTGSGNNYGIFYSTAPQCVIKFKGDIKVVPDYFLRGNSTIKSLIELPEGLKRIGSNAFAYCSAKIDGIPNTVEYIGSYAFAKCTSLNTINIPNSVKEIGEYCFQNCVNLSSITLPDKMSHIPNGFFSGDSNLVLVEIPSNCTSIGDSAFSGCKAIKNIYIPNSVTDIGYRSFYKCTALESINFPKNLKNVGEEAFLDCSKLKSEISLPEGTVSIGKKAFYNLGIESVVLPSTLKHIGDNVFTYCDRLSSDIIIPEGIEYVGTEAFSYCSLIESIVLPSNLKEIPYGLLQGCTSLNNITLPEGLTAIGRASLYGTNISGEFIIPNTVETIGDNALTNCRGLTKVVLPESMTSVSYGLFQNCENLEEVNLGNINDFKPYSFYQCSKLREVLDFSNRSSLSIGDRAFYSCSSLKSLILPNTPCTISGTYIFSGCTGLISVDFGKVQSIPYYFLQNCSSLTEVFIPETVTNIAGYAFSGCSSLTKVRLQSPTPPTLGGYWSFPYTNDGLIIEVPKGSLSAYQTASNWSNTNIKPKLVEYEVEEI